MTLEEFIKQYYGSNSGLAKELSVSVQCVYDFKASRERMYRYLPQLKKHTGLSADEIIKIIENE